MQQFGFPWNNTVPPDKLLFPDYSVKKFGEFSLDTAQKVFDAAINAIDGGTVGSRSVRS